MSSAASATYPVKPIRMIAPEAGGGNDFVARVLAQELGASLGQQVIVDNRGGTGGVIAGELLIKAPADGYTLMFYSSGIWTAPLLQSNVRYDAVRDFAPVTAAASSPNLVVIHPSLAVQTVRDLIALARAKPGQLNYASGNSGSANHLAAELFKSLARVDIVRIPYKGTGPALNDVAAGQVQLMFPAVASAMPHIKAGRLKPLAVTSIQPSALVPGLPTAAASGLPGYEAVAMSGVFAPVKTPPALLERLNMEFVRILSATDIRDKLLKSGVEPIPGTPQAFAGSIKAETARLRKLIAETGVRID